MILLFSSCVKQTDLIADGDFKNFSKNQNPKNFFKKGPVPGVHENAYVLNAANTANEDTLDNG